MRIRVGRPFIQPALIGLAAVITACLGLMTAEGAARIVAARLSRNSYSTHRNPYGDRFWRPYTAPQPRNGEQLIIVITNSQGYLQESDPALGYPAQLEGLLNAQNPAHKSIVANWALPGANAAEHIILAARAADHRPDLVLIASFSNNFSEDQTTHPLSYANNDVEQMAYLPQVRRRLSDGFLRRFRVHRPRAWLATYSALMNFHESVTFWLRDDASREDRLLRRRRNRPPIASEPVAEDGMRMMHELRRVLQRGLPDTPVLIVNMPISRWKIHPETWRYTDDFFERSREIFRGRPKTRVLDARESVDPALFYSATHMLPQGHARFARWLFPHVAGFLKGRRTNAF